MRAEDKLNRLQGSNKRIITSKEIIHSLSEAHEDHMRQLMNSNTSGDLEQLPDPWTSIPTSASLDTSQHQIAANNLCIEIENSTPSRRRCCDVAIFIAMCGCCRRKRFGDYQKRRARSTLTTEEEREHLVDCDALGLTWENIESLPTSGDRESVL